jgi:hypothetical protein
MPDSIGDNRNHDVSGMTSKNAPAVPRRIRHVSLLEDVLTSLKFQDCFASPYLDDKGFGMGNLRRSALAGRSQPHIDVSGSIHLVGLPQKLVAANAKGHAFSLLAQVNCLFR